LLIFVLTMKSLVAILLVLTVLISSIGVAVNTHMCKKEGVITSYYIDSGECVCEESIEKEPVHKCCHKITQEDTPKKGCCQDESEFFKLDFDYTTQIEDVSINPDLIFTAALIYTTVSPTLIEENTKVFEYKYYSPPIPNRDIPVFIQSFLI